MAETQRHSGSIMRLPKHLIFTTTALACLLVVESASARPKHHRVVIAVTSADEADWHLTVGNIRNLLAASTKKEAEIEVVAYGPGLSMLIKPSIVEPETRELLARHVRFLACENSMRARHITTADLVDGAGTVPSGIVEVVTRQEQGWAYIKAGR